MKMLSGNMVPYHLVRRRMRQRARWYGRGEKGQALTEFALVVPIIVMILLFSIWFTELVTIKLKVQEAARYVAYETTSYAMHDYSKGPSSLSGLANKAMNGATKEAVRRYADLDSTTTSSLGSRIFSAKWTRPVIFAVNQQEEAVYGGAIVNFIFGIAAAVIDLFSAMQFKNGNVVAMALVALGKDWGGARTARMFGSSEWGFNRSGYITATVSTYVTNKWFNRGVGSMILPNFGVFLMDSHGVLADSWRLNKGGDVYGNTTRPGAGKADKTAFWKQVDRIYFVNKRTRSVGKGIINVFKGIMMIALATSLTTSPSLGQGDFMKTAVVSKNYKGNAKSGQVEIKQDRGATKTYDSAPVCASCSGGESLKPYGESLKGRGKNFMGCKREMSLGCPGGTLSQGNPFGDYVDR